MRENSEIQALFRLMEDPDEVVYETVSNKIVSLGTGIISNLEHYGESNVDTALQEKIDALIKRLHFEDLKVDFAKWSKGNPDLLSAALLIAKYFYPLMDTTVVFKDIEKMRRNIWLEMNSYLTPMEQINIIGSIVYNYYKQSGIEINYENPDGFLVNKAIELHKGNTFGNGTLLLILCGLLDLPVYAINIPKQFILGYFDQHLDAICPTKNASEKIKFYIDPVNGQMYSLKDVENYLKKMNIPLTCSYFKPFDNKSIVLLILTELKKCFNNSQYHKKKEIETLIEIISS